MTGGGITINNFVTSVKAICLHCKNQLTNFIIKLSIGSSVTTLATSSIPTLKPQHIYTVDKMDKISPFGITRSVLPTTKRSNVQNIHAYLKPLLSVQRYTHSRVLCICPHIRPKWTNPTSWTSTKNP